MENFNFYKQTNEKSTFPESSTQYHLQINFDARKQAKNHNQHPRHIELVISNV